ncbi:MAG: PorV/PorQ family protein, partial [Bacteroidales bacterium]|nr:PorV/PorQ family protein [Bacteroidales bacterium]
SHTKGIEATFSNVAGMAFSKKTEIAYSNTIYMQQANVMINSIGVVQNLGETRGGGERGNLGLTVMVMTLGKIPITTVEQPEGGLGYYSPTMMNLALSYARSFSQAVHAGISFNLNNQTASDVRATGFTIDLGVQYVTGRNDQFQIGVALRNLGLPVRFRGDGMNTRTSLPGNSFVSSLLVGTEEAEMPALLALGASYDFLFGDRTKTESVEKVRIKRENAMHRISVAGAFIANAYSRDQIIFGVEYSLLDYFQLRAGYTIEGGMFNENSVPASNYVGPSVGTSILIPLKKGGKSPSRFAIDYSYRFTREWQGCHGIGARLIL